MATESINIRAFNDTSCNPWLFKLTPIQNRQPAIKLR